MNTQNQVGFIAAKIQELQTAILHSHSNCLLKFPDSLAKTVFVDEVGCIWITVKKPLQLVHEFDRSFHVALNYYRKGAPFFLNVFGIARLVIDPEEINQLPAGLEKELKNENLLLAVRILQASYYEKEPRVKQNSFQRLKQSVFSLFTGENDDYYHFDIGGERNCA